MKKTLMTAFVFGTLAALALPAHAGTKDDVKCVQQGLLDAGFDPNGVDGGIGNGTRGAVAKWQAANPTVELPKLTMKTSAQWCRAFKAQSVAEAQLEPGAYNGVFNNNGNLRCGVLNVDYDAGHLYRFGQCNRSKSGIAEDAQNIDQTAVIDITDKKITVLDAEYQYVMTGPDSLMGEWSQGNFKNPIQSFRKVSDN